MNICLDIQSAVSQVAGVGRYTSQLALHLGKLVKDDSLTLFYFDFSRRAVIPDIANAKYKACRLIPGRLAQFIWKTIRIPRFDFYAGKADLYHFPNFIIPPLSKGKRKTVVTVHDMSFARFPQFAEERNLKYLTANLKNTLKVADAVIAVSNFSAHEICELTGLSKKKVFAIHQGISRDFKPAAQSAVDVVKNKYNLTRPYILTVGTIEPRKNIPFAIDVFEKMKSFDGRFVIAGRLGWKCASIVEKIRGSSRAADIVVINDLNDADLPALYTGAKLFITTSHYEGFGFPPLEAMACGTPVISSDGGSLAEILGKAAIVIKGFKLDEWTEKTESLLTDSKSRNDLVIKGKAQAARYSWNETAQQTLKVYREISA